MSVEQVRQVISRLLLEPDYRELVFSTPEKALASLDLSAGEAAWLTRLTREKFQALVGGLVAHRLFPVRVGSRWLIVPSWYDAGSAPSEIVIRLGSGWAFGNGTHPTTRLCLQLLEEYLQPSATVLDVGTGSGILAIAAAKLGAAVVTALDTDPEAIGEARANAKLNYVQPVIEVELGCIERELDRAASPHRVFDLVVMNILLSVNVDLLDKGLAALVKSGGTLAASGVREGDEAKVMQEKLSQHGLSIESARTLDGWAAIVACKLPNGPIGIGTP